MKIEKGSFNIVLYNEIIFTIRICNFSIKKNNFIVISKAHPKKNIKLSYGIYNHRIELMDRVYNKIRKRIMLNDLNIEERETDHLMQILKLKILCITFVKPLFWNTPFTITLKKYYK